MKLSHLGGLTAQALERLQIVKGNRPKAKAKLLFSSLHDERRVENT